jgi:molecular chaperone GrpE
VGRISRKDARKGDVMAEKKRMEGTAAGRPKPRPPSWFKPEKSGEVPVPSDPQVSSDSSPVDRTSAESEEKPALPAPSGEVLLGPPPTSDAESLDFFEPPAATPVPEPASEWPATPGPGKFAGPAAPLLKGSASGHPTEKPVPEEPATSEERMGAELDQLDAVVSQVECLAYLKPRLARIRKDGCSPTDLTGIYRIVSQAMLELMFKQVESVEAMRAEYQRKLREEQEALLFQASSDLVASALGKKTREAPAAPPPPTPTAQEQAQMAVLRKQMEIKDELLLEAQERYDKLVRDVQNIRLRQEKDLELQLQRSRESLFRKLLPVLDSFDGALEAEDRFSDVHGVIQGLQGIHRQLLDACESEGLQSIEAVGEAFDPNFHEAMGHVETGEIPDDCVFDQIRRGYLLGDKLLRASMVRLARNPAGTVASVPGAPQGLPSDPAASSAADADPASPVEEAGPEPEDQEAEVLTLEFSESPLRLDGGAGPPREPAAADGDAPPVEVVQPDGPAGD